MCATNPRESEQGNSVCINERGLWYMPCNALIKEWCVTACTQRRPNLRCWGIQCASAYLYLAAASQGTCCVIVWGCEIFCHEGALHLSLNISRVREDLWSCHPGDNECTHIEKSEDIIKLLPRLAGEWRNCLIMLLSCLFFQCILKSRLQWSWPLCHLYWHSA